MTMPKAARPRQNRAGCDARLGIAAAPNICQPHPCYSPTRALPGAQHEVRNHFRRLLAGILFAAGLSALDGQRANADDLATIKQRGTLIVGVKADYPPFGFRSPSGAIEGIEPALAADVANSLGVTLNSWR